jgi:hypothetical protein
MMTRLSQHGGWNCELENRAKEILLGRYITNFAEEFEFAAKGRQGKALRRKLHLSVIQLHARSW